MTAVVKGLVGGLAIWFDRGLQLCIIAIEMLLNVMFTYDITQGEHVYGEQNEAYD